MSRLQAEPVEACARDGIVAVFIDSGTARALAAAWEFTYASGGLDDTIRPTYLVDCATLRRAAAEADAQAGRPGPDVRYVPVLEERRLRLVSGDPA